MNRKYRAIWQAILAAIGPTGALLIQLGYPEAAVHTWVGAIQALVAVLTPVAAAIWAAADDTDQGVLTAANSVPGVQAVVDTKVASASAMKAVNNDALPNVIRTADYQPPS